MLTSLQTLAKGNALSDAQRDAFVESVRVRLGKTKFQWDGPIQLSRSQLRGARELYSRWKVASAPDTTAALEQVSVETSTELSARVEALEAIVKQMLQTIALSTAEKHLHSCTIAAQSEDNCLKGMVLSDATIRNDTKRNHDGSMICLSGGVSAVDTPTASNDLGPSTCDDESAINHEDEISSQSAENRIAVSYFRPDPSRAPSAKLEIGAEKYNLIFHTAEIAEDRLSSVCTAQWLSSYQETYGSQLRAQTRGNPTSDFRYVASPIYGAGDPFGYKKAVLEDCVAILVWGENGQPEAVAIVADDSQAIIPLRPSKLRTANAPTHKGSRKLAA